MTFIENINSCELLEDLNIFASDDVLLSCTELFEAVCVRFDLLRDQLDFLNGKQFGSADFLHRYQCRSGQQKGNRLKDIQNYNFSDLNKFVKQYAGVQAGNWKDCKQEVVDAAWRRYSQLKDQNRTAEKFGSADFWKRVATVQQQGGGGKLLDPTHYYSLGPPEKVHVRRFAVEGTRCNLLFKNLHQDNVTTLLPLVSPYGGNFLFFFSF